MGYIRTALSKLFRDNNPNSPDHNKICWGKITFVIMGINLGLLYQISAVKYQKATGDNTKTINYSIARMFAPDSDVNFVEPTQACKEKYIDLVVENHSSRLTPPTRLHSDQCRLNRVSWSRKAQEQFQQLNNKTKFRIKFNSTATMQEVYSVSDVGQSRSVAVRFNTLDVRNGCLSQMLNTYCGMPNLVRGTYDASLLLDADNNIIDIYQLYQIY